MKTQQRNFIVERKSGRRRLTLEPASLWGGTDLRALVRQVEADAPHLFEPIASDASSHEHQVKAEPRPEPSLDEVIANDHESQILATPAQVEEAAPSRESEIVAPEPPSKLQSDASRAQSPAMVKRRNATATGRKIAARKLVQTAQSNAAQLNNNVDELAVLEQENWRLRRLLAQQLQTENAELRRMLARFSGSTPLD